MTHSTSVSAQRAHDADTRRAAEWFRDTLRRVGLEARLIEPKGNGHPIVYGEWLGALDRPTVLIYGHYDVQPADEQRDGWKTPPFEPVLQDGFVVGRGTSDDKGPMFTHICSVSAWLKATDKLPVNVKFVLEGDEESGGEAIGDFVKSNVGLLRADYCVISDTSMFAAGRPAITYGLRGLAYYELTVRGAEKDNHSGTFGGAIPNPAIALAAILDSIKGADGRIRIAHFYDDVWPLEAWEREMWARLPFVEANFLKESGAQAIFGEDGFSTVERKWARPTFDVHGITSGYQGPGTKTIIPAWASAKLSFRLVPHQDPNKVTQQLKAHIEAVCPRGVSYELKEHLGAPAIRFDVKGNPAYAAAEDAIEAGFGRKPVYIREGGSIPVVALFKEHLGLEALLIGWGRPDDNIHGPNERFSVDDFHRACRADAQLMEGLGKLPRKP